jgi:uncharacterized integral membrane protein
MYSASVKDRAIILCLLLVQLLVVEAIINTYSNVDFFGVNVTYPICIRIPIM